MTDRLKVTMVTTMARMRIEHHVLPHSLPQTRSDHFENSLRPVERPLPPQLPLVLTFSDEEQSLAAGTSR